MIQRDMLLKVVVPEGDLSHPALKMECFDPPFEPISAYQYSVLERDLGPGWYVMLLGDPEAGLDWAAHAPGPVWFTSPFLRAALLTRAAEARAVRPGSELTDSSSAPVAFRLAVPGEVTLRLPELTLPTRVSQLPPLCAALREAGISGGLQPRSGFFLRRLALIESALRGGAYGEGLGMADLTSAERAAQAAQHWPAELARVKHTGQALSALSAQQEEAELSAFDSPLTRALWEHFIGRLKRHYEYLARLN